MQSWSGHPVEVRGLRVLKCISKKQHSALGFHRLWREGVPRLGWHGRFFLPGCPSWVQAGSLVWEQGPASGGTATAHPREGSKYLDHLRGGRRDWLPGDVQSASVSEAV